jgi:hypothetical protein
MKGGLNSSFTEQFRIRTQESLERAETKYENAKQFHAQQDQLLGAAIEDAIQ